MYRTATFILPVISFAFLYTLPKCFELKLVDEPILPDDFNGTVTLYESLHSGLKMKKMCSSTSRLP